MDQYGINVQSGQIQGVREEIRQYKKINKRNDVIIVVLSFILLFSLAMMIYVRFFG